MYADSVSKAMQEAMDECERRRKIQLAFNQEHHITPTTIQKGIRLGIEEFAQEAANDLVLSTAGQTEEEFAFANMIADLERQMEAAARNLRFERAAGIRDKIAEMKRIEELNLRSQQKEKKKAERP